MVDRAAQERQSGVVTKQPKLPRKPRRVVVLAYLLVMVALLEVGLRVVLAVPTFAAQPIGDDDLSWRRAWVFHHAHGSAPVDGFGAYDPELGWRGRPNLRGAELGDGIRVTTNSAGFRSDRDFPTTGPADRTRVVVLGDSFTFGLEVSDGETFCDRIGALLPRCEVLNLGVPGYGHDQMLLLLEREGPALQPDVVVLGYVHTDSQRNLMRFRDYAKPRFTLNGDGIKLTGVPVAPPAAVLDGDWKRPRLLDLLSLVACRVDAATGLRGWRRERVTARILSRLAAEALAMGAAPVLAYLPFGGELADPRRAKPHEAPFLDWCRRSEGVRCVSLLPALAASGQGRLLASPHGHWTAEGHRIAGTALAEFLSEERLVPDVEPTTELDGTGGEG